MKKIIIYLILCFMAVVVFGQTNVPAIVVSTFSARGQAVSADDAESITELFIAELANQSGVRVVDRTSIERVVNEMRFQTSDWSNPQKTAQLGTALNAEYLVRGQINQLGQQISIALTALDIKTLEVVSSTTRTFNANNIYTTDKGALFGRENYGGEDGKIYSSTVIYLIAKLIADPIKTKMTAQGIQNYLVGTWRATGNNYTHIETNTSGPNQLFIIFNNDGTFTYTMNECFTASVSTPSGGMFPNITNFVLKFQTEGNGSFEFKGNNMLIFRGNYRTNGIQISKGATSWDSSRPYNVNNIINFSVTVEITSNGQIMQWKERPEMSGSYDQNKQIPIPTMFQKVSSR